MLHQLAAVMTVRAPGVVALLAPTPTPTPEPSGGGFDFSRISPDPAAVPRSDLFYKLANAALFLGVISAVAGLAAGAIAFGIGPIFGAHIISDRGKSMMWKAGLVAIVVGSATSIIAFLLSEI
ncbi:hypothetical protein [Micromonospora peucetia]|uniref:Uncharacterized protein n=1 Tax=Micromonospora peucetia TaxID=47871 RepID=A0A1C6W636_9ACTN|nr:hypothetical protein [Micromonospora peucetia]SCL73660.1 hypothetical protein GA0070608_5970 [Micromonospora peucetia]